MEMLTPELKREVEEAGDSPVRLTDPQTHRAYVLLSAEEYDRMLMEEVDRLEQAGFRRTANKNAKSRLAAD
jgi:PHD/YefM family antitoxin component YafN of YafNO toxin-antitoxin module